jgi:hypothetical protein
MYPGEVIVTGGGPLPGVAAVAGAVAVDGQAVHQAEGSAVLAAAVLAVVGPGVSGKKTQAQKNTKNVYNFFFVFPEIKNQNVTSVSK